MLSTAGIEHNLDEIQRLYDATSNPLEAQFYAKLATLELCGWIETAVDDLVLGTGRRLIIEPADYAEFEQQVVARTYGFHYGQHIRPILVSLVGLTGVERLEAQVNPARFHPMCAELGTLKSVRDSHAHSFTNGATTNLDAPSAIRGRYTRVRNGLADLETVLTGLK